MKEKKLTGRVLPPKFKEIMELSFGRRLTDEERAKIAAGGDLKINLAVLMEHRIGKFEPQMDLMVLDPDPKDATEPAVLQGGAGQAEVS